MTDFVHLDDIFVMFPPAYGAGCPGDLRNLRVFKIGRFRYRIAHWNIRRDA
jgi:hypothetical protein